MTDFRFIFKLFLFAFTTLHPLLASDTPKNVTLEPSHTNLLAGTKWHLIEFQSMDDAQGIKRTDDPSKYTMNLHEDGTVTMKLNCNIAKGTWSIKEGQSPISGQFQFGKLATTRAFCPPPSMDGFISMQAPYIRSYLFKDEKLYLSLMADGGIFVWDKNTDESMEMKADPKLETAIRSLYPDYNDKLINPIYGMKKARYVYGHVDLNEDGNSEVFVYLMGSIFCGTGGCNLLLFTEEENGYRLIDQFATTRIPVIVSNEKNHGWRNITWLKSGGGYPSSYLTYMFNGKHYIKTQSTSSKKVPDGMPYLSGELTFHDGIPLEPNKYK